MPETLFLMRQLIFLCFMLLPCVSIAQKRPSFSSLETYLAQLSPTTIVNFQVESLTGEIYFSKGPAESVPSASIIKIPILVELMEQVKAGKVDLDETYTLVTADKTGGSGVMASYPDGQQMSLKEVARLMMIASDNTATNIFIRKLGREKINDRMKFFGLASLQLNRVMMDTAAVARGIDNYVTARDINALLRLIYGHKVATPALCEQMMEFLFENRDTVTLPRLIPKTIKIAHKTGGLTYVRGDAGIVFAATPFVISVFVRGTPEKDAEKMIGEIGEICFNIFNKKN
ncbi:serine hydrolase [Runella aurantiaca]|uniref:beta-lactamase n=2 Tax=Runella aurantiaca TaxID=2282308 RepID=A0A369ILF3_9BACT|nr:serine hydrolase [Runella aurantiaca]